MNNEENSEFASMPAGFQEALLAEVAHYKAALDADRGVIARLQAELAKYTGPLTDGQAGRLTGEWGADRKAWLHRDAAIRAAREGER